MKLITILALLFVFVAQKVNGQITYPDGAKSDIHSTVSFIDDSLQYTYTILNRESSTQVLSTFIINVDDSTLSNPPFYTADFYLVTPAPNKFYIDGIVVSNAISGTAASRFLELPPENGLAPGESLIFSVSTLGLPSIQLFYSEGFVPPYNESLVDSLLKLGYTLDEIFYDINDKSYSTHTVASKIWPDSTSLSTFIDTMEVYRHRSCTELGWANDTKVCEELENDLSEVKTALEMEDSLSATNALAEFIALVETEKDASLTSEGYALMYFNAQYLADRLPEPQAGSGITCGCDNPVTQSSGTITLRNGETKCLSQPFSGSVFFESGGVLNVCSVANFQNVYGNQPGQINVSETGELTVGGWNNNATEDAFTNWGSVTFSNWTTINNGSLTNHGTMSVNGGLNQNNGPLVNTGELTVTNSATFNQPGNRNEGTLSAGSLTLNSNAELVNECRVESSGPVMINGDFIQQPGAFLRSENQLTVNSGGMLSMQGGQAMVQVNGVMLNGAIEHTGINLLVSSGTFNFNSGATITTSSEPFNLVAPNLSEVSASFNVADGSSLSIPPSSCNHTGYPSGQ